MSLAVWVFVLSLIQTQAVSVPFQGMHKTFIILQLELLEHWVLLLLHNDDNILF